MIASDRFSGGIKDMKTDEIVRLIDQLDKSSLVELELKTKDFEISLRKKEAFAAEAVSDTLNNSVAGAYNKAEKPQGPGDGGSTSSHPLEQEGGHEGSGAPLAGEFIESPIVGTFYRSPSPDSPAFVEEGTKVKEGDTICILEAMKVMNELEADFDCKIVDILVENGQMVEYGTPMFRVERT